jgi:hypothetical protein
MNGEIQRDELPGDKIKKRAIQYFDPKAFRVLVVIFNADHLAFSPGLKGHSIDLGVNLQKSDSMGEIKRFQSGTFGFRHSWQ